MMIDYYSIYMCKMCLWNAYGLWNKWQSSTYLVNESETWLKFLGIWMYVILLNFRSSNLTRKNLRNNVGSLTWYKPLSCETTNCKQIHTSRERTPCKMHLVITQLRHYIQQHCSMKFVNIRLLKTTLEP